MGSKHQIQRQLQRKKQIRLKQKRWIFPLQPLQVVAQVIHQQKIINLAMIQVVVMYCFCILLILRKVVPLLLKASYQDQLPIHLIHPNPPPNNRLLPDTPCVTIVLYVLRVCFTL